MKPPRAEPVEAVQESEPPKAKSGKKRERNRKGKKDKQKKAEESTSKEPEAAKEESAAEPDAAPASDEEASASHKRKRRRTRSGGNGTDTPAEEASDKVTAPKGSTRLEAKRMRRREGRKESRRRQSITEAEFLARRESVDREMLVRHKDGLDQIAVTEDGLLVEHYVARRTQQSIVGNIYLGRVQNVLPSMEAAFIDIGRGRNAVLYAGEVNWDALGMEGKPRRIEQALNSGDAVLVQVTKDPIGHKGARLTSQITLAGRYLVLVPGSQMLGISRKLPDTERARLKKILKEVVPENTGVIVRTAAEGATDEQLKGDVTRLVNQWKDISRKQQGTKKAPQLLRGEPELVVRVVRDIFNEDFKKIVVQGDETWDTVADYVEDLSPELRSRVEKWTSKDDLFAAKRVDQQLSKGMDRKVWLPSGGTLVIDRTEALTVVDVNTGKFVGSGGTLEETVTRNNLEAAEEIVRQLRLRDIGGIIIIDFVDMVLESNRELVLKRLIECLGRDRTRHQVTEITSLGLVQMTRKRVGEGLVEAFSTTCETCDGRGFIVHDHPVELEIETPPTGRKNRNKNAACQNRKPVEADETPNTSSHVGDEKVKTALSAIAAATVKPADEVGGEEAETEVVVELPRAKKRRRVVSTDSVVVPTAKRIEPTASAKRPRTLEDIELPKVHVDRAPKQRKRRRVTSESVSSAGQE